MIVVGAGFFGELRGKIALPVTVQARLVFIYTKFMRNVIVIEDIFSDRPNGLQPEYKRCKYHQILHVTNVKRSV